MCFRHAPEQTPGSYLSSVRIRGLGLVGLGLCTARKCFYAVLRSILGPQAKPKLETRESNTEVLGCKA